MDCCLMMMMILPSISVETVSFHVPFMHIAIASTHIHTMIAKHQSINQLINRIKARQIPMLTQNKCSPLSLRGLCSSSSITNQSSSGKKSKPKKSHSKCNNLNFYLFVCFLLGFFFSSFLFILTQFDRIVLR